MNNRKTTKKFADMKDVYKLKEGFVNTALR